MHGTRPRSRPAGSRVPADLNALARAAVGRRSSRRNDDGELHLGGLAVSELARQYGTPLFVLTRPTSGPGPGLQRRLRRRLRRLCGGDVYYAGKAFLCTAVARWVAEEGLRLDVCTGGELAVALRAGFPGAGVALHGNNKSDAELDRAARQRRRPDRRRLLRRDRPARRDRRATAGDTAGCMVAGDRRRRGAHPRVHRHRPRGPEVRLLHGRRTPPTRPGCPPRRKPWPRPPGTPASNCWACTATSARRSSTPDGFAVAAERLLDFLAAMQSKYSHRAARARPRRRLRHRLHPRGHPAPGRRNRAGDGRRRRVPSALRWA